MRELKELGRIAGKGLAIVAGTAIVIGFAVKATGGLDALLWALGNN